ncbi:hypothetical protein [Mycolicibacterium phlei]|uniref:hypothetical protein n=1 Tax=Mycolicibacterium phlei TaxID=1771 RepID=UPI001039D828|nr:hypothetical protein [Mycolicibacterium phlei]
MSDPGWWYPPVEGARWQGPTENFPTSDREPEPAAAHTKAKRDWVVPAALAVGAAGVASAVTLGVVLWPRQATAPVPPTIATAPVPPPISTTSAPQSAEYVAKGVQASMQEEFDSDPDLSGLKVTKVGLVHKSGNEYKGIATVRTPDGESHDVPVDVTADDDNLLWETPPGALAFAYPPPPQPVVIPPPPASAPLENFKVCPSGLTGVASADTSCAFADNVRAAWYSSPGSAVMAYSPVTGQMYLMRCAPATTDVWAEAQRCVGTNARGALLVVYID